MRRALALCLFACVAFGRFADAQKLRVSERPELREHFDRFNATGTFVLLDAAHAAMTVYNPTRAAQRLLPASTFKIFNSLVALEAGIVGLDDTIKWDGVERGVTLWNQDQRMRDAFQRSTVWFYQELARRVGERRMQSFLEREQYGNANLGGGIDQFWLTGDLRISAHEQIDFLERLHERELGFSSQVIDQVEELLGLERCPTYILRGKTGWTRQDGNQLGWLVGWVERNGELYYYAMNLESPDPRFPMIQARQKIVRGILREVGVLPESCNTQ
jgi:beta-lactamase class D